MKIFIRVDASKDIGTGHLNRCLNLADALRLKGCQSLFAINNAGLGLQEKITKRGHRIVSLGSNFSTITNAISLVNIEQQSLDAEYCSKLLEKYQPDLLIVDHYNLDYNWERMVKPMTKSILVIDDLANRKHECSILLDQTPVRTARDYANLVEFNTLLLIGPEYTILHPDFSIYRNKQTKNPVSSNNLLVGMGGLDSNNLIPKILTFLEQKPELAQYGINVVISSMAPQIKLLEKIIRSSSLRIQLNIEAQNFAQLLAMSDFAICAGGLMSLELACLGVPALILPLNEIQSEVSSKLSEEVDFFIASNWASHFESTLSTCIDSLLQIPNLNKKRRIHTKIDGLGTMRLVDFIINHA
jgi:UDP-2,4-diacetamido-2,4,6-trideoxy-beta-L-altropyranose hydrolase